LSINNASITFKTPAFGVPAFLYVESTDAIEVSTQKICTPCLVIETQNAHSFCQTGKVQDFLFKMLGAIGLEKANIKCITINALTLDIAVIVLILPTLHA
jgi:hypothetical protein